MNILSISVSDEGGAGIVVRNLNRLFNNSGFNSKLVVYTSEVERKDTIVLVKKNKYYSLITKVWAYTYRKYVLKSDSKYYFFNTNENKKKFSAESILNKYKIKPDVIIINWVSGFINTETIVKLQELTGAIVIWMMMDNALFTGGCHYPWDCNGYLNNCSSCPAVKGKTALNNLEAKKKNISRLNKFQVVALSSSDYKRAKSSALLNKVTIKTLLLPVNKNKFKPIDLNSKRNNQLKVFYAALSLNEERKGYSYFLEALKEFKKLCTINNIDPTLVEFRLAGKNFMSDIDKLELNINYLGLLGENELIKEYQKSDLYLSTSIEDTGPMTIYQSLMCGTPVLSFRTGVAIDLIINNFNGFIVPNKDSFHLAEKIIEYFKLDEEVKKEYEVNARYKAVEQFSEDVYIKNFKKLIFNEIK